MRKNSSIGQIFSDVQETMKLKFRGWESDLPHSGEKGGVRERRVADFLLSVLPKRYGVGTGHIIDSQKEPVISHQTDIIIYDALDGISLPIDNYYSLYPCECVYAAIEVKSSLDASDGKNGPNGDIYDCLLKTNQLKKFDRKRNGHALSPIHSIVFAYGTIWKQDQAIQLCTWFEKLGNKYSLALPEMVMILLDSGDFRPAPLKLNLKKTYIVLPAACISGRAEQRISDELILSHMSSS